MQADVNDPAPQKSSRKTRPSRKGCGAESRGSGGSGDTPWKPGPCAEDSQKVHLRAPWGLLQASPEAVGFMHRCAPLAHSCPGETELQLPRLNPKQSLLLLVALLDTGHIPTRAAGSLTKLFPPPLTGRSGATVGLSNTFAIFLARVSSWTGLLAAEPLPRLPRFLFFGFGWPW